MKIPNYGLFKYNKPLHGHLRIFEFIERFMMSDKVKLGRKAVCGHDSLNNPFKLFNTGTAFFHNNRIPPYARSAVAGRMNHNIQNRAALVHQYHLQKHSHRENSSILPPIELHQNVASHPNSPNSFSNFRPQSEIKLVSGDCQLPVNRVRAV